MKKGVRCWFLFLVVAIIFSSLVISEEFAPKTYQALGFYFEECGSVEGCESLDLVPVYSYCEQSIPLDEDGDEWACQTEDPIGAECDGNLIEYQESPLGSGCIVYSELENWDGIFDADNPCDSTKLSVGFNIDSNTAEICRSLDLTELPKERVGEEWLKLLMKSEKPSVGLKAMLELGVLDKLHPEVPTSP